MAKQRKKLTAHQEKESISLLEDELRENSRNHLLAFTCYTFPQYEINWHHHVMCSYLDDFAKGKIDRLMVFMPPRHGKSELVSRRLPAFLLGQNPDLEIITASYSDTLASSMNKDVQRIIATPEYNYLFPETKIGTMSIGGVRTAQSSNLFEVIGKKGRYKSAGIGTGITGMGADVCFIGSTRVLTCSGYKRIEEIEQNDLVWSYNHETRKLDLKRVKAISNKLVSTITKVKTSSGIEVVCTPDHNFWTTKRGYQEAGNLENNEEIIEARLSKSTNFVFCFKMLFLFKSVRQKTCRLYEICKTWAQRFLLLEPMFKRSSQCKEQKKMFSLSRAYRNEKQKILRKMSGQCERGSQRTNIFKSFSSNKTINRIKRWVQMLFVFFKRKTSGSSYRRRQDKQCARESNNDVPIMSYQTPQIRNGYISSTSTEISKEKVKVYDITVEENHNFFAECVLVHNCIIDDPVKDQSESDYKTYRERAWNWYTSVLSTRLSKKGRILCTMTRWHEDDLAGRLLQKMKTDPEADQWVILDYPAVREDMSNPIDPREIGEPLWENKYNKKKMKQIKASVGQRTWNSLYQQRPSAMAGNLVLREWIKYYGVRPLCDQIAISADLTYKKGEFADFAVIEAWGRKGGDVYLLDQIRGQMNFPEQLDAIREMTSRFPAAACYIEEMANGAAVIETLKGEILGLIAIRPRTSKEARLQAVAHLYEAGNIHYPNPNFAPWVEVNIEELVSFPNASNDDTVDVATMAISQLAGVGSLTSRIEALSTM